MTRFAFCFVAIRPRRSLGMAPERKVVDVREGCPIGLRGARGSEGRGVLTRRRRSVIATSPCDGVDADDVRLRVEGRWRPCAERTRSLDCVSEDGRTRRYITFAGVEVVGMMSPGSSLVY